MQDIERCAQFIDWLEDSAETSSEEDFFRDMAQSMRSGKTIQQFVESRRLVRPEVDWHDPR